MRIIVLLFIILFRWSGINACTDIDAKKTISCAHIAWHAYDKSHLLNTRNEVDYNSTIVSLFHINEYLELCTGNVNDCLNLTRDEEFILSQNNPSLKLSLSRIRLMKSIYENLSEFSIFYSITCAWNHYDQIQNAFKRCFIMFPVMKTFHRTNVSSKTYQIIGSRLKCEHTQIKEICSACSTQNRCKYMNALAIQEEGNNITHLLPQCSELDEKCDSLDNMDQSKAGEQVKAKATEIYNNWQTYKQISKQMKQN